MSTFRKDFAKILAKPHPNCHVVCGKLPPIIMIWRTVRVRRMGKKTCDGEGCQVYGYKNLREEQNLAVKGILSGRDVFVTGSPCACER